MEFNKNLNNKEIAQLLYAVAAAYEIKNPKKNQFRIIAYQRAAQTIELLSTEVKTIWKEGDIKNIPDVGKSIAEYLDELFRTGSVKHFKKIFSNLPASMFEFMKIKGIGPKTAYKLATMLNIKSAKDAIKRLEQAARNGKIQNLEGFGADSEQQILKSIRLFKEIGKKKKRMLISYAENQAKKIIDYLKKSNLTSQVEPLGSLRRKSETIGDIDIAAATKEPKQLLNWFLNYPEKDRVLEKGDREASIVLKSNIQIDLITQDPKSFGGLLQHFTGSKEHNIKLRRLALTKGLSLSEYGIKNLRTGKVRQFSNEKDFYNFLDLDYIPPELRENIGEIELAKTGNLPKLLELKDIKGDLHLHSDYQIEPSHDLGHNTMDEIVKKCMKLNYQYLSFSEHNPSQKGHTDEQIINLIKKKKQIINQKNKVWKKWGIFAFNGLEIDIKPDGRLAFPDKGFDYLDFAIASVHSSFDLNETNMTKRIIAGLKHPKVKILGHPSGRKLLERKGYEADWEKIFEFCAKNNKAIEINASPKRLDLPADLVRQALKFGVKFAINSDAHAIDQLEFMKYGLFTARKGGLSKETVINTFSLQKITKFLIG